METKVINGLRCVLKAKNVKSDVIVTFPPIHILVEEFSGIYGATCIEYSQYCEDQNEEKAVNDLIFIMYQYFFTLIEEKGPGAIWEQLNKSESERLWAKLRALQADIYRDDMKYIKATYDGNEQEMEKYAQKILSREQNMLGQMKSQKQTEQNEDRRVASLIELFKEELEKKNNEIRELREELKEKEWEEKAPELKYTSPGKVRVFPLGNDLMPRHINEIL